MTRPRIQSIMRVYSEFDARDWPGPQVRPAEPPLEEVAGEDEVLASRHPADERLPEPADPERFDASGGPRLPSLSGDHLEHGQDRPYDRHRGGRHRDHADRSGEDGHDGRDPRQEGPPPAERRVHRGVPTVARSCSSARRVSTNRSAVGRSIGWVE